MPKNIPENELYAIEQLVAATPTGCSIKDIYQKLPFQMSRRTLQRRLALLVKKKRLVVVGKGRASRYRLPDVSGVGHVQKPAPKIPAHGQVYIPISSEGEDCKKAISQPIQYRTPVGYNRKFLELYRPNKTSYLTPEIRQKLHEIGISSEQQNPAGTHALKVFQRLLIDLSWNSSRLEGNTYSLLETEMLLELGEVAEGKDAREAQMILNHKEAIELLVNQADETGLNNYTILNLHGLLSDNLLTDPQACGRLRSIPVGVRGSVYHPLEVPQVIEECFRQILATASEIEDPFEQAFFVMVHIPYLQPFEDVNKRVSRLASNIPLIRHNLCPLSFVDVPEQAYIDGNLAVYELNRIELLRDVFVWAYNRSCARYSAVRQSLGEPDPIRLKYREQIKELVAKVVRDCVDKRTAVGLITRQATEKVPAEIHGRFVEIVETELSSLHEGNIARYRLRIEEFRNWLKIWK